MVVDGSQKHQKILQPPLTMAFTANPLSLSVPEPAFETWLRDSGYLEILDERTTNLDSCVLNGAAATTADTNTVAGAGTGASTTYSFFSVIFSHLNTIFSLFTLNPFAKLTADDFAGETPSWTAAFIGAVDCYCFPSSPAQARLRVHENIKRYARNYATLFILIFACSLYQIPVSLLGLISTLGIWELFRLCGYRWGLDKYPSSRHILLRLLQCATAVILYCSNVQMAFFCAVSISYTAMILHASLRKLGPSKQPLQTDGYRRFLLK